MGTLAFQIQGRANLKLLAFHSERREYAGLFKLCAQGFKSVGLLAFHRQGI